MKKTYLDVVVLKLNQSLVLHLFNVINFLLQKAKEKDYKGR